MGIKKFRQWFLYKFHFIAEPLNTENQEKTTYDHLYFDLNQNFHKAARHVSDADEVMGNALAEIENDLKTFKACKSVHLVLDGYELKSFRLVNVLFRFC
jgi:hypothetical protein